MFTEYLITIDQLTAGLYIRLDSAGKKNPFRKKEIKIKDNGQIDKIRAAGIEQVTCILEKSDSMPLPPKGRKKKKGGPGQGGGGQKAAKGKKTPVSFELMGLKKETVERNKARRRQYRKVEKRYEKTMGDVVTLLRRASGRSSEAASEATEVVDALVGTFLAERETMINLMSSKSSEESKNYHALNVTVLALMVGKELKFKPQHMHILGQGALFHDIGKGRVPMHVVRGGATSLNTAAEKYAKEHPIVGARLVNDFPDFPKLATQIVLQHHERINGTGYPKGIKGDAINPLSRVVAVTDTYDRLVNVRDGKPMTPHKALKHMYGTMKTSLDPRILAVFIRNMGVYPPGTVVKLSNGQFGMVTACNPARATRPTVLMYHPEIPKDEALMVDLVLEEDIQITETFSPDELPRDVFNYLSPSPNINYYAEAVPEGG